MAHLEVTDLILLGLYPTALCAVIGADLARRIIPNLVVAALVAGFGALCLAMPVPDLSLRLLLAGAVTALGFSLFAEKLLGAGDAKLAGALMLWIDPVQVPLFAMATGIIGALLTLGVVAERRHAGFRSDIVALARTHTLPYGVALAGAGLILLPFSSLMRIG
ncbi:prepilin peptidase [Xanthobacter dioxanivorans]|uniref:Prepilin peptidase n=1 Tax=Xanthobacter dioxanivorans TaxID=2528964 RepID=A0A974PQ69_9HYPH|nr:prepilin peptidase [Xanthobacter dioxanivorans]QRG07739.1 prepilin peptidase [Xanthobacter dioxanivorans]